MKAFSVQMLSHDVPSDWWKTIVGHFVQVGDPIEIRCWKEELAEIAKASSYGIAADDGNEVSVKGVVTGELLDELLTEAPADKDLYNKMTKYFTVHVKNERCDFWSAHYGTEMYIEDIASDEDAVFFERVMGQYPEDFSIGTM